MTRLIATFEHLWCKYGKPERIRCGMHAYEDYTRPIHELHGGYFYVKDDQCVKVVEDPALPPHEVAWDLPPMMSFADIRSKGQPA